jgi:hypothetical protein
MKYAGFTILLGVLILASCAGPSPAADDAWKVVVPQTLFDEKLRIAAFLNEEFGFNGGAGDIGKARYTTDGGKTWTQADTSGG